MSEEEKIERPQTTDDGPPEEIIREEKAVPGLEQISEPLNVTNDSNDTMEVHKHPHHVTHKKNWGEYFLEFLMLFLAVFLGFMAESYREHLVEKKREKEYMKEIVENLKYDSVRCTLNADLNVILISGIDSFRKEIKNALEGNMNSNALYYYAIRYGGQLNQAVFNTSAISELKNSGSLRLIENKTLVNELADYYERKIIATGDYDPSKGSRPAVIKTQREYFSLLGLENYIRSYDNISMDNGYSNVYEYKEILTMSPSLKLLKTATADLERLYNEESGYMADIKYYNFWLYLCRDAASKLITDIRNQYHLE